MKLFVSMVLLMLLVGCQATRVEPVTKQQMYPRMYEENVKTILVVPASNRTTAADAASLYATTLARPLAEAGYYVYSIPYTEAFFASEGIIDGEQTKSIPASQFNTLFGADSVLYVSIRDWDTSYYVVGGEVEVGVELRLVSTRTGIQLWHHRHEISKSTGSDDEDDGLLEKIISTAITTAQTDYVPIARDINLQVMDTLPVGQYHENNGKDQEHAVSLFPKGSRRMRDIGEK